MFSILFQLTALILTITIWQTIVYAQMYDDYEDNLNKNKVSDLGHLLNYISLINSDRQLNKIPQNTINYSDSSKDDDFDKDIFDDRSKRKLGTTEHLCVSVRKDFVELSDSDLEYRPSAIDEKECVAFTGDVDTTKKEMCYVHGNGCQTLTRDISVFKRIRRSGHCWKPEIRTVSLGCKCHFNKQSLEGKTFV